MSENSRSKEAEFEEALRECVEVLESSILAIDDWLNTYASELCDVHRVKQARERIYALGTIGYIADTQLKNRNAIKRAKELLSDSDRALGTIGYIADTQ